MAIGGAVRVQLHTGWLLQELELPDVGLKTRKTAVIAASGALVLVYLKEAAERHGVYVW